MGTAGTGKRERRHSAVLAPPFDHGDKLHRTSLAEHFTSSRSREMDSNAALARGRSHRVSEKNSAQGGNTSTWLAPFPSASLLQLSDLLRLLRIRLPHRRIRILHRRRWLLDRRRHRLCRRTKAEGRERRHSKFRVELHGVQMPGRLQRKPELPMPRHELPITPQKLC